LKSRYLRSKFLNRRTFLKTSSLAAVSLSMAPKLFGNNLSKNKRNVILYVVDDPGPKDAGCYGNPVIKTPGLDHLGDENIYLSEWEGHEYAVYFEGGSKAKIKMYKSPGKWQVKWIHPADLNKFLKR
jgi:hypothetical protein